MNSVILGFLSLFTAIHENPTPVIGVFTIPSDYAQYPEDQYSYFAASYVKFLESGGARVVPIPYEADESVLEKIFQQVNGIFVTGGSTNIKVPSKFTQSVAYLLERSMQEAQSGNEIPFMAVCLGHETVHYILSEYDDQFYVEVEGEMALSKKLEQVKRDALFYRDLPDDLFKALSEENLDILVYYNHRLAIGLDLYDKHETLRQTLQITAIGTDLNGVQYVASTQGINAPIFTVQYHPEKVNYEWKIPANHSLNSIKVTQNHGDVFVDLVI